MRICQHICSIPKLGKIGQCKQQIAFTRLPGCSAAVAIFAYTGDKNAATALPFVALCQFALAYLMKNRKYAFYEPGNSAIFHSYA